MKKTIMLVLAASSIAATSIYGADCQKLSSDVTQEIIQSPENVLALVSQYVSANEGCGCEVVKAAIVATEASKQLVAQIVQVAIEGAPKEMNVIATCAIAVAPDAYKEVQAVYAAAASAQGTSYSVSEKGGKSGLGKGGDVGEVATAANPLEFPVSSGVSGVGGGVQGGGAPGSGNPVGPAPGTLGSTSIIPTGLPVIQPPVVTPPSITNVGS